MDIATMKKLVGDSIALPIAGQFKTLSITALGDDGTVAIKDLVVDARLAGQTFTVTLHALHSHRVTDGRGRYEMKAEGAQGPQLPFVWHDFHVQAPGGPRLHLSAVYRDGALLGYSYDRTELGRLASGAALPVFGSAGWQVIKVVSPLAGDVLKTDGGELRLVEAAGGRFGFAGK